MIATKDRAHLCCRQHDRNWQAPAQGADLPVPTLRPVEREEEQGGFARSYGFADLLEAGYRKTSSASETDRVQATLHQQRLDAIRKPCRRCNRAVRRTCEDPSRYRALEDIAARSQPQTPSGQAGRDIGNELTARPHDEAEQARSVVDVARNDAPTLRL